MVAGLFVAAFMTVEPAFQIVLVGGVFDKGQRIEVFAAKLPMMLTLIASLRFCSLPRAFSPVWNIDSGRR